MLPHADEDDEFSTVPDALSLTVAETPGGELLGADCLSSDAVKPSSIAAEGA